MRTTVLNFDTQTAIPNLREYSNPTALGRLSNSMSHSILNQRLQNKARKRGIERITGDPAFHLEPISKSDTLDFEVRSKNCSS